MNKRPVGITILAILQILNAAKKLAGVAMTLGMESIQIESSKLALSVLLAGLQIAIAIGFFKGWSWAHVFACIALSLRAMAGLISLPGYPTPMLMLFVCSAMIAIVVYLMASRKVRSFFYGGNNKGSQQIDGEGLGSAGASPSPSS